jgi:SAM-dependent methyltransferase
MLTDLELQLSPVVANCAMNRERGLAGPNSYARDLSFDIPAFLRERLRERGEVAWLDLCCGSGRALIEAARLFCDEDGGRVRLVGVDLVPMFLAVPAEVPAPRLEVAAIADWSPDGDFDLITCVHGLHYVGDKLGALRRAVSWLRADGRFLAHLDPANLRFEDASLAGRAALRIMRAQGWAFDPRRHLLSCDGPRALEMPWSYVGADDRAGPNVTGQDSVDSLYRPEAK